MNNGSDNNLSPQNDGGEGSELRSLRRLCNAGLICAAVSLFIGGIFLSLVALGLSAWGFVRIRKMAQSSAGAANAAITKSVSTLVGRFKAVILAAFVALVLNVASVAYMWPYLQEYIDTGDPSALYERMGIEQPASQTSSSETGSSSKNDFWG